MNLSRKGLDFIIAQEATGPEYYTRHESMPNWPGESSGVTIGIGYDLGYNTISQVTNDWSSHLFPRDLERLSRYCGVTGEAANQACVGLRDIVVPWAAAVAVFEARTVPRFYLQMLRIYPHADQIHPDAASALLSLVFNRGTKLTGERRTEMMAIRNALADNKLDEIPKLFRDQVRLWPNTEGLRDRRIAEAELFAHAIA
jgi:hypothetical protein